MPGIVQNFTCPLLGKQVFVDKLSKKQVRKYRCLYHFKVTKFILFKLITHIPQHSSGALFPFLYLVPCIFFLVSCILNLVPCILFLVSCKKLLLTFLPVTARDEEYNKLNKQQTIAANRSSVCMYHW
jgi:hypothetical protein